MAERIERSGGSQRKSEVEPMRLGDLMDVYA